MGRPPPPAAAPQQPPRSKDPFGLGAPSSQPAPQPRGSEPTIVVDDALPETRGAEEISLDMGGPRGAPQPSAPSAPSASSRPGVAPAPAAQARSADGGEAQLREALGRASREVIEKIAWEVVPQLAETIIRQELDRLIKEREGK